MLVESDPVRGGPYRLPGPGALLDRYRLPDLPMVPAPAARSVRGGPHQGPPHTSGALTSSPNKQPFGPFSPEGQGSPRPRRDHHQDAARASSADRPTRGPERKQKGIRSMTERETLARIILDTRNSLETAQAAVCDLLDEIAVDLTALESLSELLSHSNICTSEKPESIAAQRFDETGTR